MITEAEEFGPFVTIDVDMSPPNSCSWCGIERREHMQRWMEGIGWHGWIEPSDSLRLIRMRSRAE